MVPLLPINVCANAYTVKGITGLRIAYGLRPSSFDILCIVDSGLSDVI